MQNKQHCKIALSLISFKNQLLNAPNTSLSEYFEFKQFVDKLCETLKEDDFRFNKRKFKAAIFKDNHVINLRNV